MHQNLFYQKINCQIQRLVLWILFPANPTCYLRCPKSKLKSLKKWASCGLELFNTGLHTNDTLKYREFCEKVGNLQVVNVYRSWNEDHRQDIFQVAKNSLPIIVSQTNLSKRLTVQIVLVILSATVINVENNCEFHASFKAHSSFYYFFQNEIRVNFQYIRKI